MVDDNVKKYVCFVEKFVIKNYEFLKGLYKIFFGIILFILLELCVYFFEGNRIIIEIKVKLMYVLFYLVCLYVVIFMYKFVFSDFVFNLFWYDYGDINYVINFYL